MSILFYNIENDFRYSVRTDIEDSIFPDCREQMSEWAKPYILNICAVNQAIVIALGNQSETIGIELPLCRCRHCRLRRTFCCPVKLDRF